MRQPSQKLPRLKHSSWPLEIERSPCRASLIGKRQLAPHRPPGAPKSLGQRRSDVAQAPNLSPWNIVANYPFASESVSVSSDGTFAYAVGGFDPNIGGPTNAFNLYDPVANAWTPLPNIPGAFYDAPSVYDPATNSVYVFGGLDATFTPSNVVQIYDVGTGIWTTGAPMPGPRYFAGAAYYGGNGRIYVISGFDENFTETTRPGSTTLSRIRGTPRGQTCLLRRVALDTAL